jgi:AAA ATPase domain
MVTAFVGRDHELAMLAGIRARAAGGRRALVVVTGAAGIGKTWFCEHAAAAAERDGFRVVWGRCWPHGGAPALWPWPAILPQMTGTAGAERYARFTAVAGLLTDAVGRDPTMIIIDDAHHADESALLLTRFLASALDRLPLVIVLTRRPDPVPTEALLGELARDATTIPLRPFDLDDTAALLAAQGQSTQDGPTLLRVTGGSPLYLARAVERGWAGTGPATVEHAIAEAIARLAPPDRRILALAALLGADCAIDELAGLAERPPAEVRESLHAAAGAGLVDLTQDRCAIHDLVRQVAIGRLDAAKLLDAHARAAALLAGSNQVERVAHHALAAAVRSAADTERAIAACRAAASALRDGYAYEQAADLLGKAVALTEGRPARPELLLDRADTVLASGRLTDARAAFEAAAEAAELAGDPVLVARAMLGLGGVWVHEHRNAAVRAHVLARQRAALDALPEREATLRCRLAVRLAAEAVYEGGPVDAVLEALAATRNARDPRALAEALSLTHHALLAPEHAAMRLPLAEEQITVASAAGDAILALFGWLWRTADLYLLGDPAAEESLTELRTRSTALGVATVDYIVACMDVMRLIRAGRLDEAEVAAGPCLQLGLKIGDADATGYFGVQLLTIRWLQGRDAELADLIAQTLQAANLTVVEQTGCRASAVMAFARGGRMTEARAALLPMLDPGLDTLPTSGSWLAALVMLVEAAQLLGDAELAAEVAARLRPFAELPAMATLAASCFGSVSRALGQAELLAGAAGAAVAYLEHAVAADLGFGHRPAMAVSRALLAEALVARAAPGDLARARDLLAEAIGEASSMGMTRRVELWSAAAAGLEPSSAAVLRWHGSDGWTVACGTTRIDLPDLVGLHYLSRLLERPGRELAAVDLCAAAVVAGRHEVLESTTVSAYRQRIRDLDAAIDDADANADLAKAERLRLEREAVVAELGQAFGLGGRIREFSSSPERARTAVRKAIKRAVDAIAAADPVLGGELRAAVSTGTVCRYAPEGAVSRPWRVDGMP